MAWDLVDCEASVSKRVVEMEPCDQELLRRALRTITEPSRRHRCPRCEDVFECHMCQIDNWHPLHRSDEQPTYCLECTEGLGITTLFVIGNHIPRDDAWYEYDYRTGELLARYPLIRGHRTGGRADGLWRYQEKLFTGYRGWLAFKRRSDTGKTYRDRRRG